MKHDQTKILINILTRTSNRPVGFKRCYNSIKYQSYTNIKHYVSYDNTEDLSYLNGLNLELVDVSNLNKEKTNLKTDDDGNQYAPYNLYCNELLNHVEDGWIIFLDDDDNLYHNKIIEEIVEMIGKIDDKDRLFIWQMRYPDGRLLPTNTQIRNREIKKNFIGSPCYMFHSKYKNQVRWDSFKASDFRFLLQLMQLIPNKVYLSKIITQINNYGDLGQRNDISTATWKNAKMPIVYYKTIFWYLIPKYHKRVFGKLIFHKDTYKRLLNRSKFKL